MLFIVLPFSCESGGRDVVEAERILQAGGSPHSRIADQVAPCACTPTVNGVNGNAKIFRRLARGQAFNKNKVDSELTKLGCVLTQSDQ